VIQADLVYARVGGTSLRLDLYTPSEAPSGLPTLLYLHGDAWAVGDKSDAVAERLPGSSCSHRPEPACHVARPRFGGCRACALAPAPRVVAKVSDTTEVCNKG
jgi:hypothetical protein